TGPQDRAAGHSTGDLPRPGQSRARSARGVRLGAGRAELLTDLERDDPDLEAECDPGPDHERHANQPDREEGHALREGHVDPAQLPDRQRRQRRLEANREERGFLISEGSFAPSRAETLQPPGCGDDFVQARSASLSLLKSAEASRRNGVRSMSAATSPGGKSPSSVTK